MGYRQFSQKLKVYNFEYNLNHRNERIIKAIQSGKKLYFLPEDVVRFFNYGYQAEHFITLPEDLINYVDASLTYKKSEYENALLKI